MLTNQIIRAIEPYQAQIINRNSQGMMILPGQSLFIWKPSRRATWPCGQRSRKRRADFPGVRDPYGAFGRLYLSGPEAEVDAAAAAATAALGVDRRQAV